jgi:predicted nucleic acid-binding protein
MPAAKAFIDSNVILYLLSKDAKKADTAEAVLRAGGTISVQVLNEIANVARRKIGMSWAETDQFLASIRSLCPVESLTVETHDRGRDVAERYGLSVYDSMIVAAALLAGCTILYSEDMQDGLVADKQLRVANPFKAGIIR